MKSVRIVSDGDVAGTKIFDAVTGSELRGVEGVEFRHIGGELPSLSLKLFFGEVAVSGHAAFGIIHPETGEFRAVRRIEFQEGDALEFSDGRPKAIESN